MRNKHKWYLGITFAILCLIVLVGCSSTETTTETKKAAKKTTEKEVVEVTPLEKEESLAVSFDFLGGKDVMPIAGFHGPYTSTYNQDGNIVPDYMTDEIFSALSEAGFNLISASSADYTRTRESMQRGLDLGAKYGIGWFVADVNIMGNKDLTLDEAKLYISQYYDHPAFCGVTLLDEPNLAYYNRDGNAARMADLYVKQADILQNDLGLHCYISMYPNSDLKADAQELYKQYVEDIIEMLQPKILMWDNYPFNAERPGEYRGYFWNMDLMRSYAIKEQIPFWTFVQAGAQWYIVPTDSIKPYFPNEPQYQWNVNTCLAFGAQGIQYFPVCQYVEMAKAETTDWDFQRNGIFGVWGNKNEWYFYAKEMHKQIAAVDEVLMNAVNKGVIINGETAEKDTEYVECIIKSGSFQELMSVEGETMVGCFNYNGKTALYVVNYSMEYAQYITLNLNDTHNVRVIQQAETSYVKTDALTLDMAAGEGVLVVIE